MSEKDMAWDLSRIFPSLTDPSVQKAMDNMNSIAEDFAGKYRGEIRNLNADQLLECIKDFEVCRVKLEEIALYAYLSFAANMTLPGTQALYDKANTMRANVEKTLAFFELDVGNLVYEKPEILQQPTFKDYKHFLEKVRRQVPHQLSEAEEKIIIEKDQYGVSAWEQLQNKWLGTRTFEVTMEGKKKTLSFTETYGLFTHPDRATRESTSRSIHGLLEKDGEIFSSALRNICSDWQNVCGTRKYDSSIHPSLVVNDIDEQTISSLLRTVEDHTDLYQRYIKLKARMLGLPKLGCQDIYAPLPDASKEKFDYERAKTLVIEAYNKLEPEFAAVAKEMINERHIDSLPRFGKQAGAFCSSWTGGKSSFIFQSFNGALSDIFTFVHEMGHALHDYYIFKNQTILNGTEKYFPAVVAETASIFGELLLTDLLLSQAQSDKEKREILCRILDGAGNVIFRVTARCLFEKDLYDAIKHGEFLDYETISRLWTNQRNKTYADTVDWFDETRSEWARIPHHYMANFRFYNYPYVYAQLFVYTLYQKYLTEGKRFVPKFKKILSAGCSISPVEIGKIVDLDVTKPEFWELGMKQYEHFLQELEKIAN